MPMLKTIAKRSSKNSHNFMLFVFLCAASALVQAELVVTEAFVRGLPPGQTVTAAFLKVENKADKARVLVGVEAEFAERAEMHGHMNHQGMMHMQKMERLVIEARSSLHFQTGGYHIMLLGLKRVLQSGETLPLVLLFADGERVAVDSVVRSVLDES